MIFGAPFGDPGTENIAFGYIILIFGAPGIENIDFWCPRDLKYGFLVLQEQKIMIFGALETENIEFWCSGTLLGGRDPCTRHGGAGILGPSS